ncbi:MAG: hypothetical protein M3131_11350, partial [Actinomycetota bacterium]|nr:hypothetical protein [Actinomycetota bacterium]
MIACVAVVRAVSGGRPVRDRHGLGHQLAGMLAGVALACMALVAVGEHREPILSLAPLAGSCWLVGLIVAERRRDRPSLGPLRVAGLGPRTAGGIVSRHALAAMRGTFVITAGLAVLAILLASDKDARSYAQACVDGTTSTTGVWPGAPYAVPALLALGLGW